MSAREELTAMFAPFFSGTTLEEAVDEAYAVVLNEAADAVAAHPGPIPYRPQLDEDGGFWWDTRDRDAAVDLLRRMASAPAVPVATTGGETELESELAAEVARLRKELDGYKDHLAFLERTTLPELHRTIQHHKDGKQRWRDRAENAEARVRELERPAEEKRRAEIRSSYTELISQAEQDRDHEGAAVVQQQLAEREAVWAREDELAKEFETDPLAKRPFGSEATS